MNVIQIILVSFFFICCTVLIFLIMIQSGKGGGLGILGGGSSSTPFGASTIDVVTKATWYGTAAFFILAILAAVAFADTYVPKELKEEQKTGQEQPKSPDAAKTVPGIPGGDKQPKAADNQPKTDAKDAAKTPAKEAPKAGKN